MTPTARRLRDYQAEDIERVRAAWRRGVARPAIVWATGLGKTDPVAFLAVAEMHELIARLAADEARRGGHVMLLAHRDFLLTQLRDRVHAYDPGIRVGRVQAGSREYGAPIIVATVQTASRAATLAKLPRPSLVIVDEAHHAAAKTYERIMRKLGCYDEVNPTRCDRHHGPAEGRRARPGRRLAGDRGHPFDRLGDRARARPGRPVPHAAGR